ncbi:MAG: glutamate 5-kinase [Spirochaetes bacterium RBG_16_67_19]|nr:MAG: glutamate 5-kinase [Spirochaetes bacterium RBG_16_67_19]
MRLLIKIGSALISRGSRINYRWLAAKVREIAGLARAGEQIALVTSGAVAAGMEIRGLSQRPRDALELQLLSGMGQIKLMKSYKDLFKRYGIRVAQILLTHHNFSTQNEEKTIRQIMEAYLAQGTIPIVNENDMVNKEEVEAQPVFSDNDILAALVAVRLRAECLLILTDVDGLYQANPKHNSHVALVEEVREIDRQIEQMAAKETNPLGLGGMASKVRAARMAGEHGIRTIVANGRYRLSDILSDRVPRTVFHPLGGSPSGGSPQGGGPRP